MTKDRRRDDTPPIASRVRPQDGDPTTPGGGVRPLRRHPAPGTSNAPTSPQTDRETRRRDETPKSPVSVNHPITEPQSRKRPQTEHTKTGDRTPDQTRPIDRPTDRRTDRKRTCLVDWHLSGPLELASASQFGPCAGCVGGRDGSRPSRPPHGHAGCFGGGQRRRRGRGRAQARPRRTEEIRPPSSS